MRASEGANRYVTKVDDRGIESVMLPQRRVGVFQGAGSDHPAPGCVIYPILSTSSYLTPHHHAAVTSRTYNITIFDSASAYAWPTYIRWNHYRSETSPCHARGIFSSY